MRVCVCVELLTTHFTGAKNLNFLSQSDAIDNGVVHFVLLEFIERKVHDQLTENEYGSLGGHNWGKKNGSTKGGLPLRQKNARILALSGGK